MVQQRPDNPKTVQFMLFYIAQCGPALYVSMDVNNEPGHVNNVYVNDIVFVFVFFFVKETTLLSYIAQAAPYPVCVNWCK